MDTYEWSMNGFTYRATADFEIRVVETGERAKSRQVASELCRLAEENATLRGFNGTAMETAQLLGRLVARLLRHGPAEGCGSTRYEDARREARALLKEE